MSGQAKHRIYLLLHNQHPWMLCDSRHPCGHLPETFPAWRQAPRWRRQDRLVDMKHQALVNACASGCPR